MSACMCSQPCMCSLTRLCSQSRMCVCMCALLCSQSCMVTFTTYTFGSTHTCAHTSLGVHMSLGALRSEGAQTSTHTSAHMSLGAHISAHMSIGANTSTCVRIFCPWLINEGPPVHWYWRGFIHFCLAFTTQMKSLDMRMFLRLNFLIPKPVGILAANLEAQVKLVVFAVTCFAIEAWFAPMKKTAAQHLTEHYTAHCTKGRFDPPATVGVLPDLLHHLHLLPAVLHQLLQVQLAVLPG